MQQFTRDEVKQHASEESLHIIVDAKVYDLTDFIDAHPGGAAALLNADVAGQDATEQFYNLHRHAVLQKYSDLQIGTLKGEESQIVDPQIGDISRVPYAEPTWLAEGFTSPYFTESHKKFQKACRVFIETHVVPEALEHEKTDERPTPELIRLMGKDGVNMNAMRLGPGKHLHGKKLLGDVPGEQFDYFHEMILSQELSRFGPSRGYGDGLNSGMSIGLPPVMNFMHRNPELRQRITDECFSGEKFICLAITEAFAGSDVQGIKTTAVKSEDGTHYIVNGHKKWITNGHFAE